jgi:hypothetical protein
MVPLMFCAWTFFEIVERYRAWQHRRKIRKILKNNPEVRRMSELAGIEE